MKAIAYYTIPEAAGAAGVSESLIRVAIKDGRLRAVTTAGGSVRLLRRSDVERFEAGPVGRPAKAG